MKNILEYLENTPNPNKTAFISESSSFTFAELLQFSRAIGSYMCTQQLYRKAIPILMQKSPEMIAAFFGTVYAGNYYVPLDVEMPAMRIKMILEKVAPPCVICDESTEALLQEWGYKTCSYTTICNYTINEPALAAVRNASLDIDPVYVVFTSGSTGTPKGVVTHHRAVIDYADALCDVMGFNENTVFGNQSPLYLDACLKELFPTLKHGASTYLIPKSLFMFPIKLVEYLNTHGINTVCWVASAFSLVAGLGTLEKAIPTSLHTIAFGSEVFPQKHLMLWRKALPNAKFVHLYGPTEATGMSTYHVITRNYDVNEPIPIGRPFANREVVLLNDDGSQPTVGESGEICIRGTQLSLGYYADEELTRTAFVKNPLVPYPDSLYKTGDLGYINTAGDLVFISRKDFQIKHMGHRIELAEVEIAARLMDGVEMACAVYDTEKSCIALYFVARDESIGKPQLLAFLKSNLPRYMLPQVVTRLDSMPLTAGGKVDRAKLREDNQ